MVLAMSLLTALYNFFIIVTFILAIGNWVPLVTSIFLLLILTCTTACTPLQLAWFKRENYGKIVRLNLYNILYSLFIYTIIYYRTGLLYEGKPVDTTFMQALNFSFTTWTTLGYGGFHTAESLVIITSIEALHGNFAMAIFIGVITMWMTDAMRSCDAYLGNLPQIAQESAKKLSTSDLEFGKEINKVMNGCDPEHNKSQETE